MDVAAVIQVLILILLIIFYIHRIVHERDEEIIRNMANIGIEVLFIMVGLTLATTSYYQFYICRIIAVGLVGYGYTLLYFTLNKVINKRSLNIIKSWPFVLITIEFIAGSVVDSFLEKNSGNYFLYPSFDREWLYYARYTISCLSLLRIQLMLYALHFEAINNDTIDISYYIRLNFGMYGFFFPASATFLTLVNLWLTIPFGEQLRPLLYGMSAVLGTLGNTFILISIVTEPIFNIIAAPFIMWVRWRRKYLHRYLHSRLIALVERVHLNNTHLLPDRLLYEIAEAQDYVWSHIPHETPLSAKTEAQWLFRWLQEGRILHEPGPYTRPPQAQTTEAYNLAVAKQLRWMERWYRIRSAGTRWRDVWLLPKTWQEI